MKTFKIIFLALVLCILSLNGYSQIKINSTGKVGINNSSPSYQLDMNGNFRFNLSGTSFIDMPNGSKLYFQNNDLYTYNYASLGKSSDMWDKLYAWSPYFYSEPVILSDKNLKKEIYDLDDTLDKLLNLRPVKYKMFSKKEYSEVIGKDSISGLSIENKSQIGLIAQEVQEILPEIVEQFGDGLLGIKYTEFIPILIKGLQEQQKEIAELKANFEILENDCCNQSENLKSGSLKSSEINSEVNEAKLYQNAPNPFSVQTTIKFEIPETSTKCKIAYS
jgi:hypothetical protein